METALKNIKKTLLIVVGSASLIVGVVGVLLPVLVGTPFLMLSYICFDGAATL